MDIETLRGIPLFAELDDDGLDVIARLATEFEAPAGRVLAEIGQPGSGLFVIEDGSVEVDMPDGAVVELGPGEFFGEVALLPTRRATRACRRSPTCGASRSRATCSCCCWTPNRGSPRRCCRSSPAGSTATDASASVVVGGQAARRDVGRERLHEPLPVVLPPLAPVERDRGLARWR